MPAPVADTRRESVLVAVGIALLVTTVVISTVYSRKRDDLDWSNFLLGLAAAVALVALSIGAGLLVRSGPYRSVLVGWTGAFGAIALGDMLAVWMDDASATVWVVGAVILAVSVVGYLLSQEAALTLSAVVGLALLYGKFVDVVGLGDKVSDGDNGLIWFGAIVLVFTLAVTAVSFATPHRVLIGVTVGAATVISYAVGIGFVAFFSVFATGLSSDGPGGDPLKAYHNDMYLTLLYSLVLVAAWAVCGYLTAHPGYRLLIIGILATIVPIATAVLSVSHPSYWSLVVGLIGGVVLLVAAYQAMTRAKAGSAGPPPMPVQPPLYAQSPPPAPPRPPSPPGTTLDRRLTGGSWAPLL